MAKIRRDRAGQAAMPDGTVYDWDADQVVDVADEHATELLHIPDAGFSEVLPEPAPEKPEKPAKAAGSKKAAAKKDAPAKDGETKVEEPGPENADVTEPGEGEKTSAFSVEE